MERQGQKPDCKEGRTGWGVRNWALLSRLKIERMLAGARVAELKTDFFFFFFKERVCSSIFLSKRKGSGRSEEIGSSRDGEILRSRGAS